MKYFLVISLLFVATLSFAQPKIDPNMLKGLSGQGVRVLSTDNSGVVSWIAGLSGSGTTNALAIWTGANSIGNSLFTYNSSSNVFTTTANLAVADGTTTNIAYGFANASFMGINRSSTNLVFLNGGANKMSLDYSGRLYIGNGSLSFSDAALNIGGGVTPRIIVKGTNPSIILDGDASSYNSILQFNGVAGSDKVYLYSDGANLSINSGTNINTRLSSNMFAVGDFSAFSASANGFSGKLYFGGRNTGFGQVYESSIGIMTGTRRKILTNQYTGAISFGASVSDTYLDGNSTSSELMGFVSMQYKGTDINTVGQRLFDIVFSSYNDASGNFIYGQRNIGRIKHNGNLVLNELMEIEAPTSPLTSADEDKGLLYSNDIGHVRLKTIPNIYNSNGSLPSNITRTIALNSSTLALLNGRLQINTPSNGGVFSMKSTAANDIAFNLENVGVGTTLVDAKGVAGGITIDYAGAGVNYIKASNTTYFQNPAGTTNYVGVNNTGIVMQSGTNVTLASTSGATGAQAISATQADNTYLPKFQAITMSSGQSSLTLDLESKGNVVFEIDPSASASSFTVFAINQRAGSDVFVYFLNNTGSTKTVSWSSQFQHRTGASWSNTTLTTNDGGASYRCYSTGTYIRTQ